MSEAPPDRRWEFWVTWVAWSIVMLAVGIYVGWRWGVRDERERIANTPPAASNWQIQR